MNNNIENQVLGSEQCGKMIRLSNMYMYYINQQLELHSALYQNSLPFFRRITSAGDERQLLFTRLFPLLPKTQGMLTN
jgi:hypothetical protein